MCSRISIIDFISTNYDKVKASLTMEWYKREKAEFDEDVYHDTLIKCIERLKNKNFEPSEIMHYIVVSFKTNMLRDKTYACNKYRATDDIETIKVETDSKNDFDFNLILSSIYKKFGKNYHEIFLDWLNGMTIKELNKKYDKTNMRYVIERIKDFIKKTFKQDILI